MRHLLWILLLAACPAFAAEAYPEARLSLLAQDEEEDEESVASWLQAANFALESGRYAAARLDFRKVLSEEPHNQAAARGLAEVYVQTGEYRLAQRALEGAIQGAEKEEHVVEPRTRIVLARVLLTRGEHDGVEKIADQLLADAEAEQQKPVPRAEFVLAAIDGKLLKGNVLRETGRYDAAEETYGSVRPIVQALRPTHLRVDKSKGRQPELADWWVSIGECYYWMNRLHEANDAWGIAVIELDEFHLRGNAWMARLYLEQNNDSSSRVNYTERTLRQNPHVADLRVRLAEAHFYRWRSGAGMRELDEALKLNPDHPEALALRAARYLYTDQYEDAKTDYERALRVNPRHVEALGAKALHGKMLALDNVFAEAEQAMLAVNPKPARFYEIIADGLADRFRYVEALPLYDKAIELNEKHWTAYRGRGRAALNHGNDELGKASLRKALDNDPLRNNLQTLNLLTLLESYKHFERYESEDGRWRLLIHRSEAHVMRDLYIQHLDASWDAMVKKYNFTPRTPITVEAFHRHEDFEVRTVGITGLPALGACFGQLITLDSPSARPPGSYNWASTLRHEMDHVFQLQISNGQLPRWLAEGLSVYEEKSTRPEWERHMEDQLFMHYHMDDIPPVSRFNEWFRDGSRIMFAYYLGNVMVEFIDKELGGMGAVRRMLEMFGQKETPGDVFEACLNMPPEEFDRRFLAYVRDKRIAHLRMVPQLAPERVQDLYFKYEDGEASVSELVDLALGYVEQGSRIDAETFIGLARRRGADELRDPVGARFHYVQAMLAQGNEQIPASERQEQMRGHFESAIARGLEDFRTCMLMAQNAQRANNRDMTLHWLNEAQRAWPESAQPYSAKYQLYQQAGDREAAIRAAEDWMKVDENNLEIRVWLITEVYDPARNWAKMADMAEQAINIAPLDARTHQYRAFALRRLSRFDESVRHYEFVRRLAIGNTPEETARAQANAILDKAATWLHAKDYEKAKAELENARQLDPQNPRIATIEGELKGATEAKEEGF